MIAQTRSVALLSLAVLAAASGCRGGFEIRTMAAPDAGLTALQTFRMMPGPTRRDGREANGLDDPMISNSIANRAIRDQIVKAFQDRGYTLDDRKPDFGVAFYATAREKLDVSVWDYGYPYDPRWPRMTFPIRTVTQYTEGTVVVDVVRLSTRELLWRGEARAALDDDPADNVRQLAKAAAAIVAKFPQATARVVASR